MKTLLLSFFLGILLSANLAQAQDTLKLKQSAGLMRNAFLKEDYDTFITYTYPGIINKVGGKTQMKLLIKNGVDELKSKGITFRDLSFGAVGKFYKAGNEIHSKITQYVSMNVKGGYITSTSDLMCISSDSGNSWTFIDAEALNKEKIKMLFPNFNHDLIFETSSVPIFHQE